MQDYDNIGKFVRDKLNGYRENPSGHVWENIESKISSSSGVGSTISNWWIAAAGAVVIAAGLYFFVLNDQDKTTESNSEKASQELVEDKPADTTKEETEKNKELPEPEKADRKTASEPETEKQEKTQTKTEKPSDVANKQENNRRENVKDIQQIQRQKPQLSLEDLSDTEKKSVIETASNDILYDSVKETATAENTELSDDTSVAVEFSEDKVICGGEETNLWASGGISYQWSDGRSDSSIRIKPNQTQKYSVTVWKSEENKVTHEFMVEVNECGEIYVPNAFSPNSDGHNDEFKVYGVAIEDFYIKIMNKNGAVVYESKNLNEGWDGRYNNQPASPGVYIYRIIYTGVEGDSKTKTGTITLIR